MSAPQKTVYPFDPATGEPLPPVKLDPDPRASALRGDWVYPEYPNSRNEPAPTGTNKTAVANPDAWLLVDDYRGQTAFNTSDKSAQEIADKGPLPDGYTLLKPGGFDRWTGSAWATDTAAELAHAQPILFEEIDTAAGNARGRHITTTPGQEITYYLKLREAEKYQTETTPNIEDYPLLKGESLVLNVAPGDLVVIWIEQAAMWLKTAAIIEPLRIKAKINVRQAADKEQADIIAGEAIAALGDL